MKGTIVSKKEQLLEEARATDRVLFYIFSDPYTEFTLSEIVKMAKVPKTTAFRVLNKLVDAQIVKVIDRRFVQRLRGNYESFIFIREKIIHNLSIIYRSNIVEWLDEKFNHPKVIVLFGSYRKGEDGPGSDIDIAIEADTPTEFKILQFPELKKLEEILDRKINIHIFNKKNVGLDIFKNVANGIVLYGFLDVNP
jgi:predicted nucleotidyltransferase